MRDLNKFELMLVLLIVVVSSVGAISISGLLSTTKTVKSQGVISNSISLGVYTDAACTTPATSITFGTLTPGTVVTRMVYVKNLGSVTTSLQCQFSNLAPVDAANHVTFVWDKENQILAPQGSVPATFTLTILPDMHDISSFSLDINITATQS